MVPMIPTTTEDNAVARANTDRANADTLPASSTTTPGKTPNGGGSTLVMPGINTDTRTGSNAGNTLATTSEETMHCATVAKGL